MSFLKGRIQLPENQGMRRRSPWISFIPCCMYINTNRIQLPDDSDDEQLVDEQDTHSFEQQAYTPNHISIFKDQSSQQILSRNPFARAGEELQENQVKETEEEGEEEEMGNKVKKKKAIFEYIE